MPATTPLPTLLQSYGVLVQAELASVVQGGAGVEPFYNMIAYHLGWVDAGFSPQAQRGGKGLRSMLCLLVAEALGAQPEECAALAAGIELLHNFSLVHDDIEDRSATRRGRPTVWTLWGEAQAINVGDGLFSLAHLAWLRAPICTRDVASGIAILSSLERTIMALCEGQFLDMHAEGSLSTSSAAYLTMIGKKTAALIGEAAWVGACAAGAAPGVAETAREFGRELGLAFQIRDDLLGIWGNERETGKSASSDIASRKMTLPIVLALEEGAAPQQEELRRRYGTHDTDEEDETHIRTLLEACGADRHAEALERLHWQAAMQALDNLPLEPLWRQHLSTFALSFIERRS